MYNLIILGEYYYLLHFKIEIVLDNFNGINLNKKCLIFSTLINQLKWIFHQLIIYVRLLLHLSP